jgi:hypothetical protein
MPVYYLNIREHEQIAADQEGIDLPDLEAAKAEAQASAREILADALKSNTKVDGKVIEIADETGTIVGSVTLRDMLPI